MLDFPPTREAALHRLEDWSRRADRYAAERNFDLPGHANVSLLSPYLQRRMVSEGEVVRSVLSRHTFPRVEKYIQEVLWRSYWKGWLELRPSLWDRYLEEVCAQRTSLSVSQREKLAAAEAGRTGLSAFDAWSRELGETGYLHNHARMWYASIWIFTLQLPWSLGAEFFRRHLLDFDAASNTLSWRWVAGLQSPGKHYLARSENITRFTRGRFGPMKLNESAPPLVEAGVLPAPDPRHLQANAMEVIHPIGRAGLLLSPDDLSVETTPLAEQSWCAAALMTEGDPALEERSSLIQTWQTAAMEDATRRWKDHTGISLREFSLKEANSALVDWISGGKLQEIVAVRPSTGPNTGWIRQLETICREMNKPLRWVRRSMDLDLYPLATRGFFPFWKRVGERIAGNHEYLSH